jgi:hypothetical protein
MSMEESEKRFEEELKDLEDASYMHMTYEDYLREPTDTNAKKYWLKCIRSGEPVTEDVTQHLAEIIEKQIDQQDIKRDPASHNKLWNENRLYELLHIAKTDLKYFWQILHEPQAVKFLFLYGFDDCVLDILRIWLPDRKKLKPSELYSIFEALMNGDDPKPEGLPYVSIYIDQRYRKRYPKNK